MRASAKVCSEHMSRHDGIGSLKESGGIGPLYLFVLATAGSNEIRTLNRLRASHICNVLTKPV